MLATWFGFYDNWGLRHKVIFDGPNRVIRVNEGVTELSIRTDIYSAWKEWVLSEADNNRFWPAIRTIGGDDTVNDLRAGDIYFLINGWKLSIDITKTAVTGVLFSDDFDTAYYQQDEALTPQFPALVSSLVTTIETRAALTVEQATQLEITYENSEKALTTKRYLALQK